MRYKSQAIIGVCGIVGCSLVLVLSYAFFTNVSWLIPAFTIPFMGGFAYYSYASLKEGKEVRKKRREGR